MQSRALAASIINKTVAESVSLNQVLDSELDPLTDTREQSFIRDLCFGVLRWYPQLDCLLQQLLNKPIRKKNHLLRILCWLGLYQIIHQRTADHGAVSATVSACDDLDLGWAKGMVNAVLRNYIRNSDRLQSQSNDDEVVRYAHPRWMIDSIRHDWPHHWQDILQTNNQPPPMSLRVNIRQTSRTAYREILEKNGRTGHDITVCEPGLTLDEPCRVEELPGFRQGMFSVQDGASQLAVTLLALEPGQRVLDACAAPGGKTCHILEQEPGLNELLAIDLQADRVRKIHENLERLGLGARVIQADVRDVGNWWDGKPFDRILLDAPCTASGVIRRHPDIKLLR
ncbi:MAG: 16S rRNA (cytosine(967)-C(5))-methyltransferase RsmB, partial [Thiotrichales bacterium]|nr:16S rRNA (cytosine(967)-C(5))-methyltransferase RsmB [Thiotrichales bacterium]